VILQALYQYANAEGLVTDPDFPHLPVGWLVRVTAEGRLAGFVDTRVEVTNSGRKPKLLAKNFPVPYQTDRSGTKAPSHFLVDNAKYVFGQPTADKPFDEREGAEKAASFRRRVADCVAATEDAGARAVLLLLESLASGDGTVELPPDCRSNDLFAFVYTPDVDQLVHCRPAVQDYWRRLRQAARAAGSRPAAEGPAFECMITGAPISAPGLFPKLKNIPGANTSGAPLVSFNAAAFTSYGLKGNENGPISAEAAEAAATALLRLFHPAFPDPRPEQGQATLRRRNYHLSSDTAVAYWSNTRAADGFLDDIAILFEPDPGIVADTYRSIWRGRAAPIDDAGQFYALILSGAQGRVVVRDWYTTPVREASEHLAQHFADLAIVRNTPKPKGAELPPVLALRTLLSALAPFGRRDAIPSALATAVFHAAIGGTVYPISLLQRALERTRAEIGKSDWADLERRDARAALIKAVLNRRRRRQPQSSYPELTVSLDPSNASPEYLCGRLMAVIERLQQLAMPDVNATVVDRFFGAASATPRAVFTRLLRNARHHARKAREDAATGGTARWLEGQLDAIIAHFDVANNGFPAFLDLEQQGLFVVGYHQQRYDLWRKRDPAATRNASEQDASTLSA
jgi:CRISPR-associated protein Csd1